MRASVPFRADLRGDSWLNHSYDFEELALAEWGAEELTDELALLLPSYLKRKQFEREQQAKAIAKEISRLLGRSGTAEIPRQARGPEQETGQPGAFRIANQPRHARGPEPATGGMKVSNFGRVYREVGVDEFMAIVGSR